jgi:hypothetical protein
MERTMKIIVSHDVDHITAWEDMKDLVLLKYVIRCFVDLFSRRADCTEIRNRFMDITRNKWQTIEELMEFDKKNEIPSVFFFAVNNGMKLHYSLDGSKYWIKKVVDNKFDVGVHGIEFDKLKGIKKEYETFKQISGMDRFGMRMHYLRLAEKTIEYLSDAGYLFDSTIPKLENPYKVGNLWEFPLHIMDSYIFYEGKNRFLMQTLEQAKDATEKIIHNALEKNIKYLTVLHHDRCFSDSAKSWKDWYIWIVDYLKENNFTFTTYRNAICELEAGK